DRGLSGHIAAGRPTHGGGRAAGGPVAARLSDPGSNPHGVLQSADPRMGAVAGRVPQRGDAGAADCPPPGRAGLVAAAGSGAGARSVRRAALLLAAGLASLPAFAQQEQDPATLRQLLEVVKADALTRSQENQARVQRFLEARDQQQALLEEAQEALE